RYSTYINDVSGNGHMVLKASGRIFLDSQVADATTSVHIYRGLSVEGNVVGNFKSFRIPHPTKPGMDLVHGCTESHVNGIEYWGVAELDESGRATVELPDYFEALAKPEGRSVILTPVGEPYGIGAGEVEGGQFVAHGEPG